MFSKSFRSRIPWWFWKSAGRHYGKHWNRLYQPGRPKRGKGLRRFHSKCLLFIIAIRIRRRFPVISGFRVSWDSRRAPGQRVVGVWLQEEYPDNISIKSSDTGPSTPVLKDGEPILRDDIEPKYKILTRDYMAQGHDGFTPLKGNKYLIDDESGQITSTVVRKYLLGPFLLLAHKALLLTNRHRFTIRNEAGTLQRVPSSSARRNAHNHPKRAFTSRESHFPSFHRRRALAEGSIICVTLVTVWKALQRAHSNNLKGTYERSRLLRRC